MNTLTRIEINNLKNEHKENLRQIKLTHTSNINKLIDQHEKEKALTNEENKSEIIVKQKKELTELKLKQEIFFDRVKNDQEQNIRLLNEQLKSRIEELKVLAKDDIKHKKEELGSLKKELSILKINMKKEVKEAKNKKTSFEIKLDYLEKIKLLNYKIKEIKDEIRLIGSEIYFTKISKNSPMFRGLTSFFIWGLGQVLNRQLIKGIAFFFFQILLFSIEIFSGKYFAYLTGAIDKLDIRDTGIFIKGIWGVVTLGTREDVYSDIYFIPGDRSNRLLINGLIALLILVIFIGIYVYNIIDAKKSCKKQIKTRKILLTSQYLRELWEGSFEYIVILPALILMIFFSIMPIIFGLMVAFTNYGGKRLLLFDWVGFKNFALLTQLGKTGTGWGYTFINVSIWTIIFAILATVTCFFGGLLQAIILNNKRVIGRKVWRTIIILPWAIPQLVLLLVINNAFNSQFGLINNYLRSWGLLDFFQNIGLTNQSGVIGWFDDQSKPWLAKSTVILVNMFLGMPYYMALMTGVMTSIDKEMYEAADIDGATPNQKFLRITLPIVLYMTAPLLIMSFAFNLNNFGLIYFLTGGGPGNIRYAGNAGSTDILISWIYKLTTDAANPMYNMASVFSIIIFIVIGSFSAYNFTRTKAFKEEDMV